MNQEQSAVAPALSEQSLQALNLGWRHLAHFYRTKPLGGFGLTVVAILLVIAIFAPLIATTGPYDTAAEHKFAAPLDPGRWLGGDQIGRDVYSRLVYGARISLYVGIVSSVIGCAIGLLIGVTSVHFGGKTDLIAQRFIDSMMAFPALILAIAIMAALGGSLNNVVLALTIIYIPSTARIVRAQALGIKEMDYILAAVAVGAGNGADNYPPHDPQLRRVVHRAGDNPFRRRDSGGGYPQLPGHRRASRHSLMGGTCCAAPPRTTSTLRRGWEFSPDWPSASSCSLGTCWATPCGTCSTPGCAAPPALNVARRGLGDALNPRLGQVMTSSLPADILRAFSHQAHREAMP